KATWRDPNDVLGPLVGDSGGETYAPVFYPGVLDPRQAADVTVEEGEERSGLNFRLTPVRTVQIQGQVVGANGGGGAEVTLIPRIAGGFGLGRPLATSGPDGTFQFTGITPGSFVLLATRGEGRARARQTVEVGSTSIQGIRLVLKSSVNLKGR